MGSDYYFRMGSTHKICQDYALAGKTAKGITWALLSDGCSGVPVAGDPGSPHTDYGARFLVRSTQRHLADVSNGFFPGQVIVHEAAAIARQAGLRGSALDATLLAVAVSEDSRFAHGFMTGDGVIAARQRDGKIRYTSRQFGNGAPYYLSYLLDDDRNTGYLYPDPNVEPKLVEGAATVEETNGLWDPENKSWVKTVRKLLLLPTDDLNAEAKQVDHRIFRVDEVEVVLLMSDGVLSFQDKSGTPVPLEEVLVQLFAIKGFEGEFLVRRCNAFLQRFCAERGWKHTDDFSIAGIHLGK